MLLLNLQHGTGPLYRRVYLELKLAIQSARLHPDARLPSTRELAGDLGVSRNTVNQAYEQLAAEGYIVSHARAATTVATVVPPGPKQATMRAQTDEAPRLSGAATRLLDSPALAQAGAVAHRSAAGGAPAAPRYDFRYGRPAIRDFPREAWRRLLAARARMASLDSFGYAPVAGYAPLRQALASYLRRARGLACEDEQIIIINGAQQGFDLAARVLLDPGAAVVVEEPHYPGATLTLEAAGARLIRIPVDADGLDIARLPAATADVRLACVSPCHQFPTGVIMSLARRLALLEWAARANAWIIEDDYISEYRYEGQPLEALRSLEPAGPAGGRVIYIGTFAKTLFPSLRLAYLVLPPVLVKPFLAMKFVADRFSEVLTQQALTDFITSGQFERHLRRSSARNAGRRRALVEALRQHFGARIEVAGRDAGVHLLVWLNDVAPDQLASLIERARKAGVGLYSLAQYYAQPPKRAGLLFGYAALTEAEIRAGIRRLSTVL